LATLEWKKEGENRGEDRRKRLRIKEWKMHGDYGLVQGGNCAVLELLDLRGRACSLTNF
jgi:hypothetical protein